MPLFNNNTVAIAQGYDADYYGDSSYSKYPTEDKKYECRTGPFEGFFVGSVEFCKFNKFDKDNDRKDRDRDNRTGTQGPPGPQGIQGIQGIQGLIGPPGPNQINSTSLYNVVGNESSINPDTFAALSVAACNPGDIVLSAGYTLSGMKEVDFITDGPDSTHNSWSTFVLSFSGNVTVVTFAQCFNNP